MSKLSFRARALDASKPMPIFLAEDLPDLPDYTAINRAVPQMPSGMEKEEECEHHLQRAICTGLIIPTPEVAETTDMDFYQLNYPADYKMPRQLIHMQPLCLEQEVPEYDIDSEDERWLKQQRHTELTELKFEEMMDKLERSSGQTVVTLSEAKLLLGRQDDLVVAVYDYWLNKRLKTQHPLILSVRTEQRPGQPANNPYLAFRRRTEKMQTRKNRKNDESSYEKMLKLRRDLSRAASLLQLVAKREEAKRDLVSVTASVNQSRLKAKDYSGHLAAELTPPPPPIQPPPLIQVNQLRRELTFTVNNTAQLNNQYLDPPRQREKRQYKRRKHRHHSTSNLLQTNLAVKAEQYNAGYSSSESDSGSVRTQDDGPFAFRRKHGVFYQMPTSNLDGGYDDEALKKDKKFRFTLTSIKNPELRCMGFARRRIGRGGRVIFDRLHTPLHDLWTRLKTYQHTELKVDEEARHATPKVYTEDYDATRKHPWRKTFRQHLNKNPNLWTNNNSVYSEFSDISLSDAKKECDNTKFSDVKTGDRVSDSPACKRPRLDSEYESDDSLAPEEACFDDFTRELHSEWLHFKPKTLEPNLDKEYSERSRCHLNPQEPINVELRLGMPIDDEPPSKGLFKDLSPFSTGFTLSDIYGDVESGCVSDEPSFGDSDPMQEDSLLSEADLKVLTEEEKDGKRNSVVDILRPDIADAILEELATSQIVSGLATTPTSTCTPGLQNFLLRGAGEKLQQRAGPAPIKVPMSEFGSSFIRMTDAAPSEPAWLHEPDRDEEPPKPPPPPPAPPKAPHPATPVRIIQKKPVVVQSAAVDRKERVLTNTYPNTATVVKTVHVPTVHQIQSQQIVKTTPTLQQHNLTASSGGSVVRKPQLVTVAVSEALKVRLQSHLLANLDNNSVVGLMQNGPYATVTVNAGGVPPHIGATAVVTSSTPNTAATVRRANAAPSSGGVGGATRSVKLVQRLPGVVSLGGTTRPHYIEIKSGQLSKGAALVNVVRGAPQRATAVAPQRARLALALPRPTLIHPTTALPGSVVAELLQKNAASGRGGGSRVAITSNAQSLHAHALYAAAPRRRPNNSENNSSGGNNANESSGSEGEIRRLEVT